MSPKIRVIDDKGEQRGVLTVNAALQIAENAGLDLVEISPNSDPPVCKVMDYGKYRYEKQKQKKLNKKKQHVIQVKEIRLCPIINCPLYPYRMGRRPDKATVDTLKEFCGEKP